MLRSYRMPMPQFELGQEIGWTTPHRGVDGAHSGVMIELRGPIIGIDRDPVSGDDLDYLIEATFGGRPAGPVRVPAEEASVISVPPVHTWCAEFT